MKTMRYRPVRAAWSLVCLLGFVTAADASCDCAAPAIRAARSLKVGLDAQVLQSVLVNDPRGTVKLAARAFMPATTNVTADQVIVGAEASVGSVNANLVRFHPLATVGGPVTGPLTLPVVDPLCPLSPGTCGTDSVTVTAASGLATLTPGDYATVKVAKGGFARLLPGTYNLCTLSIGRAAAIVTEGPVTINVLGSVRVASDALVLPATGQPPLVLNVSGSKVVFGLGTVVRANVTAPAARFKLGRQASFDGCLCVRDAKLGPTATANCTVIGSPSGAFLD